MKKKYILHCTFQSHFLDIILFDTGQPCGVDGNVLFQLSEEIPIQRGECLGQDDPRVAAQAGPELDLPNTYPCALELSLRNTAMVVNA